MNALEEHNRFGNTIDDLLKLAKPMELRFGTPQHEHRDKLTAFASSPDFGTYEIEKEHMALACVAGLWLRFDFLDESHEISQDLHTPEGSLWHAILHRREGDYWNSGYWYRQARSHQTYPQVLEAAQACEREHNLQLFAQMRKWDPTAYVKLCEQYEGSQSPEERLCVEVQTLEWQILFEHCFRVAINSGTTPLT